MFDFSTLHIINQYQNSYTQKNNWTVDTSTNTIKFYNGLILNPDNVESVQKKDFKETTYDSLLIDFNSLGNSRHNVYNEYEEDIYVDNKVNVFVTSRNKDTLYRICFDVRLDNKISPYYNNRGSNKGIPISLEFVVTPTSTSENICKNIKEYIKKCDLNPEKIFKISVTPDSKLLIESIKDYQKLENYRVEEFREDLRVPKYVPMENSPIVKTEGQIGFGTYEQLINEVRLVSTENLIPSAIYRDEMPIEKGQYIQYIIHIKSPVRTKGMSTIGEQSESLTTHVLWINKQGKDIEKNIQDLDKIFTNINSNK